MARPWTVLARWSDGGQFLDLRQRGDELAIVADEDLLLSSRARRRNEELARLTLAQVKADAPRVLIAGLGLGFTVRAALDVLPAAASIAVCETTATIVDWCRYAVADANGDALADPRVSVMEEDGAAVIARSQAGLFDAILLDLYWGRAPDMHISSSRTSHCGARARAWCAVARRCPGRVVGEAGACIRSATGGLAVRGNSAPGRRRRPRECRVRRAVYLNQFPNRYTTPNATSGRRVSVASWMPNRP